MLSKFVPPSPPLPSLSKALEEEGELFDAVNNILLAIEVRRSRSTGGGGFALLFYPSPFMPDTKLASIASTAEMHDES